MTDWKQGYKGYTAEDMAEAEKLYLADVEQMYKDGYAGDFGCGLTFAMDTYSPMCWQHYFNRKPPAEL